MYRALIRTPLDQVMVLLWLIGVSRAVGWLAHAPPSWKWVTSAVLGAALLMLIAARYRIVVLIPIWLVFGLVAALGGAHVGGIDTLPGLGAVAVLYAFATWQMAVTLLSAPAVLRFAEVAGLRGGYSPPGGCALMERYVYWTGFAIVVLVAGAEVLSQLPAVPQLSWLTLAATLLFLLLSGHRYRSSLNTYLAIAFLVTGVASTARTFLGGEFVPLTSLLVGAVLASSAVAAWTAGAWTRRRGTAPTLRLYGDPLLNAGVVMALLAVLHVLVGLPTLLGPGWPSLATLAVASAVLVLGNLALLRPTLTALSAVTTVVSVLWACSALVRASSPLGVWFDGPAAPLEWLVLAIMVLTLGVLVVPLYHEQRWRGPFGAPLLAVAGLSLAWCLSGSAGLFVAGSGYLPWILTVLLAALFPLLHPFGPRGELRGLGAALLLSALVAVVLGPAGREAYGAHAALVWAFTLWFGASYVLPRFNARLKDWQVAPRTWPWLGLVALAVGLALGYEPDVLPWQLGAVAASYLLLMLRHSTWFGFPWLAVGSISAAAVLASLEFHFGGPGTTGLTSIGAVAIEGLVWANLLLGLIPVWQRFGPRVSGWLGWHDASLRAPLLATAAALCSCWLAGLLLWDAALIAGDWAPSGERSFAALLAGLLSLSLGHVFVRWPGRTAAHACMTGVLATAVAVWGIVEPFSLALALCLFGVLVTAAWASLPRVRGPWKTSFLAALDTWLIGVPAAGFVLLLFTPQASVAEELVCIVVLAGTAAFVGWRQASRRWLNTAALLAVLLLHWAWLLFVPLERLATLPAVFALQFALVTVGLRWQRARSSRNESSAAGLDDALLSRWTQMAMLLSVAELGLHLLNIAGELFAGGTMSALAPVGVHAAAVATILLLAGLRVFDARRSRRDYPVYVAAAAVGVAGLYCRVLWFGLSAPTPWDTGAIIAAAYLLFVLQSFVPSRAVLNLTMALPVAALMTVPLQAQSGHATVALIAIGSLYLLARRSSGLSLPMYLGVLALNAGVYLWVPGVASGLGLLQAYIAPAAISVLLLLHLHRHELKRQVLNGVRLAAMCVLYASATADVFLQESLGIFALALGLSLAGIALGIATRTRAFLYAGIAFLIINVSGQLLQLYPDQRLGRALVLMALGAAITAAMIWFNLKREAIMERLRIVRADLADWE